MRRANAPLLSARQARDEGGATVVIVALALLALFAMIVLTIDVGGLLLRQRAMVNGSDAGALAAARSCSDQADTSLPETQSDTFAIANVNGLISANGGVIDLVNCDNGNGYVTVEYSYPQDLIFAPVLGFANTSAVVTQATAAWGPLGGGKTVPIVVESGTLQGPCRIPDGAALDDECPLYYNNGDQDLGHADWGFLNLDLWNISPSGQCSNPGTSDRRDWILNDYGQNLSLNGSPPGTAPTYVCVDTGAGGSTSGSSAWGSVVDRIAVNDVLLFPVNDCTDQRDKNGNLVSNGTNPSDPCTGTPDKYSIIGFVKLRVTAVYNGNDSAAIGTPGASGTCNRDFEPFDANGDIVTGQTINLNAFGSFNNQCFGSAPDTVTTVDVNPRHASIPDFTECSPGQTVGCAYSYDPATRTISWVGPPTNPAGPQEDRDDLRISFGWQFDGTPGACGTHPSDPNAKCVITEWIGFSTTGGTICEGPNCDDFGSFGYILCDRTLGTCPGQ